MVLISLLKNYVQFTFIDFYTREEEKKFLQNSLRENKISYSNKIGNTVSDCDFYIAIEQFKSVNDIRDLFLPDLGGKSKNPMFFKELPVDYRFHEVNGISVIDLIDKKLRELTPPVGPSQLL